jgi:hypothetical protein
MSTPLPPQLDAEKTCHIPRRPAIFTHILEGDKNSPCLFAMRELAQCTKAYLAARPKDLVDSSGLGMVP